MLTNERRRAPLVARFFYIVTKGQHTTPVCTEVFTSTLADHIVARVLLALLFNSCIVILIESMSSRRLIEDHWEAKSLLSGSDFFIET